MLRNLVSKLLRHPWLLVGTSLLAIAATVSFTMLQPPAYRSTSAIILLNPPALPEPTLLNPTIPSEFQNPYARFGDLSVIVDILVRRLESDETISELDDRGLDGSFVIAANRDFYRGPIIDIEAESDQAASASRNVKLVVNELESQLSALQAAQGTDPTYWIGTELVTDASTPTTLLTPLIRSLLVMMSGSVLFVLSVVLIADAVGARRTRKSGTENPDEYGQHTGSRAPDTDESSSMSARPIDLRDPPIEPKGTPAVPGR